MERLPGPTRPTAGSALERVSGLCKQSEKRSPHTNRVAPHQPAVQLRAAVARLSPEMWVIETIETPRRAGAVGRLGWAGRGGGGDK